MWINTEWYTSHRKSGGIWAVICKRQSKKKERKEDATVYSPNMAGITEGHSLVWGGDMRFWSWVRALSRNRSRAVKERCLATSLDYRRKGVCVCVCACHININTWLVRTHICTQMHTYLYDQ